MTLNGKWHVIVDPYENGYYNYRSEPFDAAPNPTRGYFLDRKPADRSELIEYDFDYQPDAQGAGRLEFAGRPALLLRRHGVVPPQVRLRAVGVRAGAYSCTSAPPTTRPTST